MKKHLCKHLARSLAVISTAGAAHAALELNLINTFTFTDGAKQGGIEIVSYTPDDFTVAGIYVSDTDGTGVTVPTTFGVQILTLGASGSLTERFQIDLNAANTGLASLLTVTSTALDPLGRNFGVATIVPTDNTGTLGKLVYFNYETGAVIGTIDVGFHPDNVSFSADGTKIYVANEGEFSAAATAVQAAGSISVIDISSVTAANLGYLTTTTAATFDFSAGNLGSGASLSGIRNSNVAGVGTTGISINSVPDFTLVANQDFGAIEPEYITISGGKAYVTLQDNNAIGVFDLSTQKWERINNLGTITQTIDASDLDGVPPELVNDTVKGMPMPDTIASFVKAGKTYLVTANEGDARVDDRDVTRFGTTTGLADLDGDATAAIPVPSLLDDNYPADATGIRANAELGRLNISRIDGDTDADGRIDEITMLGTRSYTIWKVQPDGSLVIKYDSGSLEPLLLGLDTAAHNISSGTLFLADSRSDDKGPEPEGLSLFEIDGKTILALALERQNGLLLFDLSDPSAPSFLDYSNTYLGGASDRLVSPEGMFFIPAASSPSGVDMLLVGYEGFASSAATGAIIGEGGIGVYQVVPEPGSALLLLAGATALLSARRRQH